MGCRWKSTAKVDQTGIFPKLRLAGTTRPVGGWPQHWGGCIYEFDGHGIGNDLDGERRLAGKYASPDVSGAWLDPGLVRQRREVEMAFFEGMRGYDRVPRSEQAKAAGNLSALSGSTWTTGILTITG